MAISESQIATIEASIKALQATGNPLVPGLRSMFPGITFVRCNADDMDAVPFRTSSKYHLYLLYRNQACITLTDQLEYADGVIVAEVEESHE